MTLIEGHKELRMLLVNAQINNKITEIIFWSHSLKQVIFLYEFVSVFGNTSNKLSDKMDSKLCYVPKNTEDVTREWLEKVFRFHNPNLREIENLKVLSLHSVDDMTGYCSSSFRATIELGSRTQISIFIKVLLTVMDLDQS